MPALWPLIAKWMPKYASRTTKASGGQLYPASTVGAGVSGRSRAQYVKADEEEGDAFQLKTMGETRTDIRGHSPQGSEDEIMRYNGIVRTVQVWICHHAHLLLSSMALNLLQLFRGRLLMCSFSP